MDVSVETISRKRTPLKVLLELLGRTSHLLGLEIRDTFVKMRSRKLSCDFS